MRRSNTLTASNAPDARPPGQAALARALRSAITGYWRLVGTELAAAGFADRRFPEGRVLVMCAAPGDITISDVGRRLGITRQGAGKIVARLREDGYLNVSASATDGREKVLSLTPRAKRFLATLQEAGRSVEAKLRAQIGADGLDQLFRTLDLLTELGGPPRAEAPGGAPALWALRWQDAEDRS
jgi:DNA-binding MarR family transcriptional regulator